MKTTPIVSYLRAWCAWVATLRSPFDDCGDHAHEFI